MSVEADIQALLGGSSAVTDLVGQRFYTDWTPQSDERPYIVTALLSMEADHAHDGRHEGDTYMVQVSVFANSAEQRRSVMAAVRAALDHQPRPNGAGVFLQQDESTTREDAGDGGDAAIYRGDQTYLARMN